MKAVHRMPRALPILAVLVAPFAIAHADAFPRMAADPGIASLATPPSSLGAGPPSLRTLDHWRTLVSPPIAPVSASATTAAGNPPPSGPGHYGDHVFLIVVSSAATLLLIGATALFAYVRSRNRTARQLHLHEFTLDQLGHCVYWIRRDGRFIHVNAAASRLLGYSREEMLDLDIHDVDLIVGKREWAEYWESLRNESPQTLVSLHETRDGRSIDVSMEISLVHAGDHEYACAIVRDISDREQRERLRQAQTELLEKISDGRNSLDAILLHATRIMERLCVRVSASINLVRAGRLRYGAAPNLPRAYVSATDGVLIAPDSGSCGAAAATGQRIATHDIASDPRWKDFRDLAAAHDLGACWSQPVFDGEHRVVATLALYRAQPGGPTEFESRVMDSMAEILTVAIEGRRLADRFLRIFESSPTGLLLVDADERIILSNPEIQSQTGYAADDLEGMPVRSLFPDGLEPEYTRLREQLAEFDLEPPPAPVQQTVQRKDGTAFPAEIGLTATHSAAESTLLVTVTDITERVRTARELERQQEVLEDRVRERTAQLESARREAERANQAKSEFLSRMSHELRTPLNAVIGFGRLLATSTNVTFREDDRENVNAIIEAGNHLVELVDDILDLSRVESGNLEFHLTTVTLLPEIEFCIGQVAAQAREKRIEPRIEPGTECADWAVMADVTRLRQVLLNLLSNAIKYNHEGGDLCVCCGPGRRAGMVRVSVRDTGPGVPPESSDRLFQPFERLDTSGSSVEGTGIGLALVKRLIDVMDGEVGVDSEPGAGSTFWFELQAAEVESAGIMTTETAGPVRDPAVAPGVDQGRSILYVEDNPANLRLVEKFVHRRPDLTLLSAEDGETGLARARVERPDLILLDINLPGMDGFETLRHLQQHAETRDIPVMAVSANAMSRDVDYGLSLGFLAYLIKPLDLGRLEAEIDRLLAANPPNG